MITSAFSDIGLSTWIAIIAALAACVSALAAWRNSKIARKALDLSVKASKLANPSSRVYLIDAFRFRDEKTKKSLYVFCLSVENKSTMPNSITGAELRIPFIRDDIERTAVFQHASSSEEIKAIGFSNLLQNPQPLSARGAAVVTCCFEVPREVLKNAEFGPYCVRLSYADGSTRDVEIRVIMDVVNAQYLEARRKRGIPV
jgi:hypothetical protein